MERDKLYSPSFYVNPEKPETVVPAFFELTKKLSEETRRNISHKVNIRYGPNENQLLDEYGTDLPSNSDIMVFIHGGYWVAGSREASCNMAGVYHTNGIRLLVSTYDLAPKVPLNTIVEETKDLINFLIKYSKENKVKHVWLMGHSAGAHLITAALGRVKTCGTSIEGAILVSGVFDLAPLVGTYIGDHAKINCAVADSLSPMSWSASQLSVKGLKFLVTVGEKESPAFLQQSHDFSKVLSNAGATVEEHIVPQAGHYSIISDMTDPEFNLNKKILQFIH